MGQSVPVAGTPLRETVRARRIEAGLSQAELAEAAGISERAVSDIERGLRRRLYPDTARRLARALDLAEADSAAFLAAAAGGEAGPVPARELPAGRMVGREGLLAEVLDWLDGAGRPVLTLLGPAGIGKTRLALEAAARAREARQVRFVELSDLTEAGSVLAAIARAIGATQGEPAAAVAERIGSRPFLLVLDSAEHLRDAGTEIARLASGSDSLRVLVTSRSPLNISVERRLRVPPLDAASALDVFAARAGDVTGEPLTEGERTEAGRVCARLEGVPLAIELAVARLGHMTVADLRRALESRLEALGAGPRDGPERHRSMQAALEWSYSLLDGPALRAFPALGLFRGGFDAEAARAVAGPRLGPGEQVDEALAGLVDSSLLLLEQAPDGTGRYRLLDTVREFAAARAVSAGDREQLAALHAGHFLGVAETSEPAFRGAGQYERMRLLAPDAANFASALEHVLRTGDGRAAMRFCAALWMFWRLTGQFAEARRWTEAALGLDAGEDVELRRRVLWGAGWLAFQQSDHDRAEALGRELEALAGGEPVPLRNALTLRGNAALGRGEPGAAVDLLRQALEVCSAAGDSWELTTSRLNLGTALRAAGDPIAAEGLLLDAERDYAALGDASFSARVRLQRAFAAMAAGRLSDAARLVAGAVEQALASGDAWSAAEALDAAGIVLAGSQPAVARAAFAGADAARERVALTVHAAEVPLVAQARRLAGSPPEPELGSGIDPAAAMEMALVELESAAG